MAIPVSELQKLTPNSILELFELQLVEGLHYATGNPNNVPTLFRFHSGVNMNNNGNIVWQGNTYQRFPITCEGFERSGSGQIPRPNLKMANMGGITRSGSVITVTDLLLLCNLVTPHNDLLNAKLTRIMVTADALDNVNFAPVTTTTTTTIADPSDAENVTYTVTVANVGGINKFLINGNNNPVLTMKRGSTYTFDVSHSSNATHPLRIKSDASGDQSVTVYGTQGQAGAYVRYQPVYPTAPNDLRYYCTSHGNAMGNTITMNNPNTTTQTTSTTTQTNPFGTPSADELPREIYLVNRKSTENRTLVEFELKGDLDKTNLRIPKRQVTRKDFPGVGTFINS